MDTIAAQRISQSFMPMDGAWGAFSGKQKQIVYNVLLRQYDAHDLAAVMGHEGQHAVDYATSGPLQSTQDCYNREARGFVAEAALWKIWFGAAGKANPTTDFEREMNAILDLIQNDPQRFAAILVDGYKEECGAMVALEAANGAVGSGTPASLAGVPVGLSGVLPTSGMVFDFLGEENLPRGAWPELPSGKLTLQ